MAKMNLMDRAIAAVAPEHALRRAAARELRREYDQEIHARLAICWRQRKRGYRR